MENKQIRKELADTALEVGKKDSRLAVLVGDISHFMFQPFNEACPGRYYNIGICEPTMMSLAAGLSKIGFIPLVHTIASFLVERSFEQIKNDFGYQRLGINIAAVGAGFDYGTLGSTHHCYDDFALMKNIENSNVVFPASCKEFNLLFKQIYDNGATNYFRIPENKHDVEFDENQIKIGKGILAKEGKDITIVSVGPQLKTAMDSVELLRDKKIEPEIIYIHTIKPFDTDIVQKSLSKTKKCLVIEEHSMYGGILEDVLRSSGNIGGIKYASINLGDKFVRGYGCYEDHCKILGFSVENLVNKIKGELM